MGKRNSKTVSINNGKASLTLNNDDLKLLNRFVGNRSAFLQNEIATRQQLLEWMRKPCTNIDRECGHPIAISTIDYQNMYTRGDIGARVVDIFPQESWSLPPLVYETENPREDTTFEKALIQLQESQDIYGVLSQLDIVSGIGRFGILIIGIDDGLSLDKPVEGSNDDDVWTVKKDRSVIYLRTLPESYVTIAAYERDPTSRRYGLPTLYNVNFTDQEGSSENFSATVHWTRVIHAADNRIVSNVFGEPRMKKVWNRLLDLKKILGGSGEMYWRGAFPGLSFEMNADSSVEINEDDLANLRAQVEKYMEGLSRYLAIGGMTTKSLAPQVAEPNDHMDAQITAICISLGIPKRIFIGSESAELASSQDSKAWLRRVNKRRNAYLIPCMIRPFIQRLINMGVLPRLAKGPFIYWPDLMTLSDQERAEVADKWAMTFSKYIAGNAHMIVPPEEFLSIFGRCTPSEIRQIMKASERFNREGENDLLVLEDDDPSELDTQDKQVMDM